MVCWSLSNCDHKKTIYVDIVFSHQNFSKLYRCEFSLWAPLPCELSFSFIIWPGHPIIFSLKSTISTDTRVCTQIYLACDHALFVEERQILPDPCSSHLTKQLFFTHRQPWVQPSNRPRCFSLVWELLVIRERAKNLVGVDLVKALAAKPDDLTLTTGMNMVEERAFSKLSSELYTHIRHSTYMPTNICTYI